MYATDRRTDRRETSDYPRTPKPTLKQKPNPNLSEGKEKQTRPKG